MLMINLNALIVKTQQQRSYYKYLCIWAKIWLQPQNMHHLCKYKHFIRFIKKKVVIWLKSWALILVFIKVHVKDMKYSIRSVWYEYDEKYEMHLFNDYLVKIFKCFCRRVTTSSEIFKYFNNGSETKCYNIK